MSLNDSELKVLEVLWEHGDLTASQIYKILAEKVGWSRNTSYTIIKRCVDKIDTFFLNNVFIPSIIALKQ